MQRLLVIDDDPSVRNFLKRGLSYEGYAVDIAESGDAGLAQARDKYPHLVILDWMMPGIDGIEVLRRFRTADPTLPIIMLTGKDGADDQVKSLGTGADDYVTKPVVFDVLVARIRSLLRRHQAEQPTVLRFADLEMNTEAFVVKRGQREINLTNLEFRLLQAFLESPERVMNKQLILDKVWGTDFFGDVNVVEVYVKQIRQKLEAEGEARLIHTIRGAGYVMRERA